MYLTMCQNKKYIRNIYSHQNILINCGKCPACLQDKANSRAQRIRNNVQSDKICLFVTLTYDNAGVPFVYRKDIDLGKREITVYRGSSPRRVRINGDYDVKLRRHFGRVALESVYLGTHFFDDFESKDYKNIKSLKYMPDKVGVCLFKDYQNFQKRLRINLQRKYGFTKSFTSFQCSEYGGFSQRPHFHALFFIPLDAEATFRRAIVESWPFGNFFKAGRFIEVARNPASYLASYVNGGSDLSKFFTNSPFAQKHSYSKMFGISDDIFSLNKILSKIERRDLSYNIKFGNNEVASVSVPQYVVNRYFPKFKGFSCLTLSERVECITVPKNLYYKYSLGYSPGDLKKWSTRLNNAFRYYNSVTGKSIFDYCIDYNNAWSVLFSNHLKSSFDMIEKISDYKSFYSNGGLVTSQPLRYVTKDSLLFGFRNDMELNPNMMLGNEKRSILLSHMYHLKTKQKYVTNHIMSDGLGLDV